MSSILFSFDCHYQDRMAHRGICKQNKHFSYIEDIYIFVYSISLKYLSCLGHYSMLIQVHSLTGDYYSFKRVFYSFLLTYSFWSLLHEVGDGRHGYPTHNYRS